MKRRNVHLSLVCGLVFGAFSWPAVAQSDHGTSGPKDASSTGSYTVFDVPLAACPAIVDPLPMYDKCIVVTGIDARDTVVGSYIDVNAEIHGFYRLRDGTVASFDPPEAFCLDVNEACTTPTGINPSGTVVGYCWTAYFNHRGFLRSRDGQYTVFYPPEANDTFPAAINPSGTAVGFYYDSAERGHGFIRDPEGNFTVVDAPGASSAQAAGTRISGINSTGDSIGYYLDSEGNAHGFLRAANGDLTPLDVPDAISVYPVAINDQGQIAGTYAIGTGGYPYGETFIRDSSGAYTTLFVGNSSGRVVGQDAFGSVAGQNFLGNDAFYKLGQGGDIVTFLPPGSIATYPTAMNAAGDITGLFVDGEYVNHVFVRHH